MIKIELPAGERVPRLHREKRCSIHLTRLCIRNPPSDPLLPSLRLRSSPRTRTRRNRDANCARSNEDGTFARICCIGCRMFVRVNRWNRYFWDRLAKSFSASDLDRGEGSSTGGSRSRPTNYRAISRKRLGTFRATALAPPS